MKGKILLLSIVLMFAINSYGQSGQDGNISWSITDSVLTISSDSEYGGMRDYSHPDNYAPWYTYRDLFKKIVIEEGVTIIGRWAFYGCNSLIEVEMASTVTNIWHNAFSRCRNLKDVQLSNGLLYLGSDVFSGCSSLMNIEIPEGIRHIFGYAFFNCVSLERIKIPNSVTKIHELAFGGCTSLMSVEMSNSLTSIGSYAFSSCISLTDIRIPNSVIEIGEKAFNSCTGLTNIEIPNGVTTISRYVFSGCTSLTSIEIPNSVREIDEGAFQRCSLTNIDIPDQVSLIAAGAFNDCSTLKSIKVNANNITYKDIDGVLFSKNGETIMKYPEGKDASSYMIPNTVRRIADYTFYGNRSLINMEVPDNVAYVGSSAFKACMSLTSVKVSGSVNATGEFVFSHCFSLRTVDVYWDEPLNIHGFSNPVFAYTSLSEMTLIVPIGTRVLYEAAPIWQDFGTIIERAPEVSVTSVSVSPKSATLMAGGTLQLNVTVSPSNASVKSVTWSSGNDAVATVDATGKVTAIGGGSATITVTTVDGGKTATFNVTVFEIAVSSVTLNTNTDSVCIGGSLQLTATVNPSYASNKRITWSSSDEAIATVDSIGNVKGISEGTVVITATSNNGKTASCAVTVYQLMNYVTVEIPIGDTGEWIVFDMERPAGSDETNSFVMGFPEGLEIDPASIILTESLLEGLELSVIPLGYNVWLFEVYLPSTFSAFSTAAKVNMAMNITYRITGDMSYMYEVISCDMNSEFYNMANVPKYELVAKVGLMSGETANGLVNRNNANASIVNGVLTVDSPNDETIKVYSITGIQVYAAEKMEGKVTYQLSNFPDGIYIVTGSKGWSIKILKK